MRDGEPSWTAAIVAFARAVAPGDHGDPVARDLVPRPFAAAIGAVHAAPRALGVPVRFATLGLVDHIALRTSAIDRALVEAISGGTTQVVILGAGLDARAWRLPPLRDATVLEVDHPSTQARKRARTRELDAFARDVRFVPVDFEKDALGEALSAAGHDTTERTFWIWEGVTPYLDREAVRATLREISTRSAPGSRLAVTYLASDYVRRVGVMTPLARAVFRSLGEPVRGAMDPEAFARELVRARLTPIEDTSSDDWAAHSDAGTAKRASMFFGSERLVLAQKPGA